ncbi:gamma-glutamyltranspeptidase/glutathione hydrolase [Thiogranum longum]|uniref:Glutathione hydrolase proenzyme n=2 Tax=Thiogranum longum TaxID=1537524 RepID=A0A4R1H5V6_9GAMM|nr:gamma-glutamyltranspeptidase/glutathione hydrolase [Thiogranum longum]
MAVTLVKKFRRLLDGAFFMPATDIPAKSRRIWPCALVGLLLPMAALAVDGQAPPRPDSQAIASAHPLATQAGMQILEAGGNAFDAAVAVTAALAVVEPYSSGIGGGGFWLLHRASDGKQVMLDGREQAPQAAHRDLYLDKQDNVVPGLSMDGALAAGIPGEPAALVRLAKDYGRLPLKQTLAPAIRLAQDGFPVDSHYRAMARFRVEALRKSPAAAGRFLENGEVPAEGVLIRQPGLAETLRALVDRGRAGFYTGKVAERLVEGVRKAGGIWTLDDLAQYRVIEREPVSFQYQGRRIVSAALPSSGGVGLATMLNILATYPLEQTEPAQRIHLVVEAMRRAYRDRAQYLGDPDFVEAPVPLLMDMRYADGLRASIHPQRATPSRLLPGVASLSKGTDTTHFSVLDREGNRVAATLSINYPFGAAFVVPGTGVLLNDEMDDFSAKPGVPNAYGLVGAEANAIAPGKRPLSSMTPTFVESEQGVAILGTPGGSRIITMLLLAILDMHGGHGPASWVALPRYHHQYLPDVIQFEPGALSPRIQQTLKEQGHLLKPLDSTWGNMQAVYFDYASGKVEAASDPRGGGLASVR